jgi:hypothetical protein
MALEACMFSAFFRTNTFTASELALCIAAVAVCTEGVLEMFTKRSVL